MIPKRILLVDDEQAVLFAYKKVLQRGGNVIVDAVESKKETVALLKENMYDVAILDLRLGGENNDEGFELIGLIRESNPKTNIFMITAHGTQEIKDKAFDLGIHHYFEKPVSIRVIREALEGIGQNRNGADA